MDELTLVYAISSIVALLAVRVLWVLFEVMSKRRSSFDDSAVAKAAAKQSKQLKTLVIAGSGGHTAEILKLLSSMKLTRYTPRCYVIATTDAHSESKIRAFEATSADAQQSFAIWKIPRSREVKQSYVSSIFTTINACLYALPIALRARADIVLCNGPGTCIPICAAIFLMKVSHSVSTWFPTDF